MEKMKKFLDKKKKDGKGLSDVEKEAKMGVVEHLRNMAQEMMGDKLKGMKKVSVASNSPEGLSEGLDKAKEIVDGHEGMKDAASHDDEMREDAENGLGRGEDIFAGGSGEHAEESPEHEAMESPEEEAAEGDEDGEEDDEDEAAIDEKLKKLMEKKKRLLGKKA